MSNFISTRELHVDLDGVASKLRLNNVDIYLSKMLVQRAILRGKPRSNNEILDRMSTVMEYVSRQRMVADQPVVFDVPLVMVKEELVKVPMKAIRRDQHIYIAAKRENLKDIISANIR